MAAQKTPFFNETARVCMLQESSEHSTSQYNTVLKQYQCAVSVSNVVRHSVT